MVIPIVEDPREQKIILATEMYHALTVSAPNRVGEEISDQEADEFSCKFIYCDPHTKTFEFSGIEYDINDEGVTATADLVMNGYHRVAGQTSGQSKKAILCEKTQTLVLVDTNTSKCVIETINLEKGVSKSVSFEKTS